MAGAKLAERVGLSADRKNTNKINEFYPPIDVVCTSKVSRSRSNLEGYKPAPADFLHAELRS